MKKMIFRFADGVITVGESSTHNVKNLGVDRNKIHQGFNAIDTGWWSSMNKSRKHKCLESGTRYIYVGQLIQRKRIDLLIESYSRISREIDSLLIVGDGPLEQELKSLSENLNSLGKIEFRNSINSETLRSVYLEQDILILPSDFEVWGMVALEALACELGLILSASCGVTPELKNFSNVLVFRTKEELESSLMEARSLKPDPELNSFFQDKSIEQFSKLISSLCTLNGDI
jgi:glycosyltransferase involved in cell wall biosynthesis